MDEHEHEELEGFEVGVGIELVGQREGNEQSGFDFTCLTIVHVCVYSSFQACLYNVVS